MKAQKPKQVFTRLGIMVEVYDSKVELGKAAAEFVAARLSEAIQRQGQARAIFATGASQYEFLDALVQHQEVDWRRVTAFHLDEYLGMSDQHPASFRRYLNERLFSKLPFAAVHLLRGDAPDAKAECRRYAALLEAGPIDIACIGIGENGHLAFNDPPADFRSPNLVNVVNLDTKCRMQQVGEGHFPTLADVPTQALSLSIPAILRAKTISCVVPDTRKAEAVRCSLEGRLSRMCPASVLRRHPDVHMYLDEGSASLLSAKTRKG